jgi:hypothetical protein
MSKLSDTATSILTILNNINDLIVQSSKREEAQDVMRALRVYAKNMNFPMPQDKIENFYAVLIDSKPFTLTSIIKDIAEDVIMIDSARGQPRHL